MPVPRVLAHADGGPPVDAPCFVMEYLEGVVPLAELPAGWAGTEPERHRAGEALVDVLVRLHAVDPEAVGLADFGRPGGLPGPPGAALGHPVGGRPAATPTRAATDPAPRPS